MTGISFLDLYTAHAELRTELQAVWHRVLEGSEFIGGPLVEEFEQAWAAYCGTTHCVGVANGTAALELVLRALAIGPGAEVIVPANSFVATAEAVVLAGAQPVFVDVNPATLLVEADVVRAAIGPRTAAVIPVHLYGQPVDMDAISAVAESHGLAVIEDAAQAHGASWMGRKAGSMGIAGCFSFYPGKNLGAFGDAGAVVTSDGNLAARIRALSNHGRPPGAPQLHQMVGTTNRLDALQAGILSVKLPCLDRWTAARRQVAGWYRQALADLPVTIPDIVSGAEPVHHLAVVLCNSRDEIRADLQASHIPTGVHYPIPCHQQAAFRTSATGHLPVAEWAARRVLSLPMHPYVTTAQVEQVTTALRTALTVHCPEAVAHAAHRPTFGRRGSLVVTGQ